MELEEEPARKRTKFTSKQADDDRSFSTRTYSSVQTEASVGIQMYLSDSEGFTGIMKHRYSDFLVNEIDQHKKVVHLSSFKPPEENVFEEKVDIPELLIEDVQEKLRMLSQEISCDEVQIKVTEQDKSSRTKIHHYIRQSFKNLSSSTKKIGDENFIIVEFSKQGSQARGRWPPSRPDYTSFVLYKENTDSMEATRTIAKCLNMNPNAFTYAGTKDKRAKTSQNVSVYRVQAEKLLRLNSFLRNMKIGNVTYQKEAINLGDLSGNRFTIILRSVSKTGPDMDEIVKHFAENGFINYFGLQRFGTTSIPTQSIGRSLILEDYEKAVELILQPRGDSEFQDMQECRSIWQKTHNAQDALTVLRNKNCIEGILLKGLATHQEKDFLNAFNKIPRNTRLLYLHSYQSYIWNYVVSMRISKLGLKPVVGDLYLSTTMGEDSESNQEAKLVTAEVLKNDMVTMYDVVLPLPGHSVLYPENEVSSWYKELLEKDGLSLNSFRTRVKEYSLGGCYRHILVKPENVTWEQLKYDHPNEMLVAGDYENLQNSFHFTNDGERNALKIEFSLPSSTYATMAVRELMKMESTKMVDKTILCSAQTPE